MSQTLLSCLFVVTLAPVAVLATGYEITSRQGDEVITYMVRFGGGKQFESYTGFDPISKQFVYLSWPRGDAPPQPVSSYWDPTSARHIVLYQFPDTKQAIPVISSIDAMKVCPLTGDKNFKHKAVMMID